MSNSPTMRQILDPWMIAPLRELGKNKWLEWESAPNPDPTSHFPYTIFRLAGGKFHSNNFDDFQRMWNILKRLSQENGSSVFRLFAISQALVTGPKVLRPSIEQCEALEHVDVNVSFEDYEQPFPVFFVELPERYRQNISKRFNQPCAKFVSSYHDTETKYIISSVECGPEHGGTSIMMSPRPQWKFIEEALRLRTHDGQDLAIGEMLARIAINFGLILTRFGVKDCGPVDPVAYDRNRRAMRSSNEAKAKRAREFHAATMNLITLEQDVLFHKEIKLSEPRDATGPMRKPHWRRGHFRKQPYGPKLSLRKIKFIKPIFIHGDYFHGEMADTDYHIRQRQGEVVELDHGNL